MRSLPMEGFFEEPEPVPMMVMVCPHCGFEVTGLLVGEDDVVDTCRDHGIVEGRTVEVPWEVYEAGPDAVLAYVEAQRMSQ